MAERLDDCSTDGYGQLVGAAKVLETDEGTSCISPGSSHMSCSRSIWPLCLLCVLAPAMLAAGADRSDRHTTSAPSEEKVSAPAFRLGTAARPFGWSTAVADVNHDGQADVVVA